MKQRLWIAPLVFCMALVFGAWFAPGASFSEEMPPPPLAAGDFAKTLVDLPLWNRDGSSAGTILPQHTDVEIKEVSTDTAGIAWAIVKVGRIEGYALQQELQLTAPPVSEFTITFSTGNLGTPLRSFDQQASRILNDPRGWSLNGRIRFVPVRGRGDFTLWIASPRRIPELGCSSGIWSCRQGHNVSINAMRWYGASPAWTRSLKAYRQMVVNHETGHWLGFGHSNEYCQKGRRKSPVMLQQSGGLRGCSANPWPLPAEQDILWSRLKSGWWPSKAPGTAQVH